MTKTIPASDSLAFENAAEGVMQAHRRHVAALCEGRRQDAPASRRALYNALKTYRHLETEFYRAVMDTESSTMPGKNENHPMVVG